MKKIISLLVIVLWGLLEQGCAPQMLAEGIAYNIKVHESVRSYLDPSLKTSELRGKNILVLPILSRDVSIDPPSNMGDFERFAPYAHFSENLPLLKHDTTWQCSFNGFYQKYLQLEKIKATLRDFDSLHIQEETLADSDFNEGSQPVKDGELKFKVPAASFFRKIGQDPDFVLYVSEVRVTLTALHPTVTSCGNTCVSVTYKDKKDLDVTTAFEYSFWDVRRKRMVACGYFEQYSAASDVYPLTDLLAYRFTRKVMDLTRYLAPPPPSKQGGGMYGPY